MTKYSDLWDLHVSATNRLRSNQRQCFDAIDSLKTAIAAQWQVPPENIAYVKQVGVGEHRLATDEHPIETTEHGSAKATILIVIRNPSKNALPHGLPMPGSVSDLLLILDVNAEAVGDDKVRLHVTGDRFETSGDMSVGQLPDLAKLAAETYTAVTDRIASGPRMINTNFKVSG